MLLNRWKSKPPELSVYRLEEMSVMHCVVWVNMTRTRQSQSRIILCVWVEERLEDEEMRTHGVLGWSDEGYTNSSGEF